MKTVEPLSVRVDLKPLPDGHWFWIIRRGGKMVASGVDWYDEAVTRALARTRILSHIGRRLK